VGRKSGAHLLLSACSSETDPDVRASELVVEAEDVRVEDLFAGGRLAQQHLTLDHRHAYQGGL
jgi:hypothetical protein